MSGQLPAPRKFFPNPIRIAAQIKDGEHLRLGFRFAVVNAKRKPVGEHPEKPKMTGMDSVIKHEAFNVSNKRVGAVITDAGFLLVVKDPCLLDVFGGFRQNDHGSQAVLMPHAWRDVS